MTDLDPTEDPWSRKESRRKIEDTVAEDASRTLVAAVPQTSMIVAALFSSPTFLC